MKDGVFIAAASSHILRITNITESDEGMYKCVAKNKGGMAVSNAAAITIYGE